ncbi:hypothetical protein [Microtetraspora malaysiensis]
MREEKVCPPGDDLDLLGEEARQVRRVRIVSVQMGSPLQRAGGVDLGW